MGSSKPHRDLLLSPARRRWGKSSPQKKTRKRGGEKIDCFFEKGWNIMLVWENVKVLGGFYFCVVCLAPPHMEMCGVTEFWEGAAAPTEKQQTTKRAYDGQHEN